MRQQVLQESGGTVDGLSRLKKETLAIVSEGSCTSEDRKKLKTINRLYRKAVKVEKEKKASVSVVEQEDTTSNCQAA